MRQEEFSALSLQEKAAVIYERAVYLGKRKEAGETVTLYQLEGYYIEIFYLRYRREIKWVECFTATDRLDPYLPQIDVEEFTGC